MKKIIAILALISTPVFAMHPAYEYSLLIEELNIEYNVEVPNEDKIAKIEKALDIRIEMIDTLNGLQRYILVNKSAFMLEVIDNGYTILNNKVIIGRNGRETPEFTDTLMNVVLDPYWNVPSSLARTDIIPKLKKVPNAANIYGYHLIDKVTGKQVPITSTNIDLNKYRIRQKPRKNNSLGEVKFMFPWNKRNIYIHDTPTKSYFDSKWRKYSSGCVRLQNPFELAQYLMGTTPEELQDMRTGKERWLKIPNPIKVFVVDWPTYIDQDGVLHYVQ